MNEEQLGKLRELAKWWHGEARGQSPLVAGVMRVCAMQLEHVVRGLEHSASAPPCAHCAFWGKNSCPAHGPLELTRTGLTSRPARLVAGS